jgi:hypothetical protein
MTFRISRVFGLAFVVSWILSKGHHLHHRGTKHQEQTIKARVDARLAAIQKRREHKRVLQAA